MFEFVFKMFAVGSASLPEGGMGEVPNQIAAELPKGEENITLLESSRQVPSMPSTSVIAAQLEIEKFCRPLFMPHAVFRHTCARVEKPFPLSCCSLFLFPYPPSPFPSLSLQHRFWVMLARVKIVSCSTPPW